MLPEPADTKGSTSSAHKLTPVASGQENLQTSTKDIPVSRKSSLQGQGSFESSVSSTLWERKRNSWLVSRGERSGASRNVLARKMSDTKAAVVTRGGDNTRNTLLRFASTGSNDSMHSTRPEWALDTIAMGSGSESDLEFFDAKGRKKEIKNCTYTQSMVV